MSVVFSTFAQTHTQIDRQTEREREREEVCWLTELLMVVV